MKNLFLVCAISLVVISFVWMKKHEAHTNVEVLHAETTKVVVENSTVMVEIADTEPLQEQGLSGRRSLKEDYGMLFVFSTPVKEGFWMKDMLFPIDIIWANNGHVVSIENSLSPNTYPRVFYPKNDAQYVLEVPAGYARKNEIRIGSNFSIGH